MSSSASFAKDLLQRNATWSDELHSNEPHLLKSLEAGQAPKVLWIGCSDSRLPESVVCCAKPGEIFVTRNIANQFNDKDDSVVSVLTYGVQALGVEDIVVVGHTSCGGVNAAIAAASADAAPADAPLTRYLTPLVQLATKFKADNPGLEGAELTYKLTEASVKQQVENVVQSSVVQSNWKGEPSPLSGKVMNKIRVHGWIHNVGTGKLQDLNITRTS